MDSEILTYHFIKMTQDNASKLLDRQKNHNAVICFDLEDSFNDFSHQYKINAQKEKQRELLINLLSFNENNFEGLKIGIRINSPGTKEFLKDLTFLNEINCYTEIESIFIPKIETPGEIESTYNKFINKGVYYKDIIPIIETVKGMKSLKEIAALPDNVFNKLAFGHCDFNLDQENFPFHHQFSEIM